MAMNIAQIWVIKDIFLFFHEDRKADEYSCSYEEQREGLQSGEEGCSAEGHSEHKLEEE